MLALATLLSMKVLSKRYLRILRLRERGLTFDAIGDKLGFSRQRAWQLWKRAFTRTLRADNVKVSGGGR